VTLLIAIVLFAVGYKLITAEKGSLATIAMGVFCWIASFGIGWVVLSINPEATQH
jgi:hypothetical protein